MGQSHEIDNFFEGMWNFISSFGVRSDTLVYTFCLKSFLLLKLLACFYEFTSLLMVLLSVITGRFSPFFFTPRSMPEKFSKKE